MALASNRTAWLSVLTATIVACTRAGSSHQPFGELVGMAMEGSDKLPSWQITFSARRPTDPHALVDAVAGLALAGVRGCPDFVSSHLGRPVLLSVQLAGGKASARVLQGQGDGAECVAAAMDGRKAESPAVADLQVQILVPRSR